MASLIKNKVFLAVILLIVLAALAVWVFWYRNNSGSNKPSNSNKPLTYKYQLIGNVTSLDVNNNKMAIVVYKNQTEKVNYNVRVNDQVYVFDTQKITLNDLKVGDEVYVYSNQTQPDSNQTFVADKVSKIDNSAFNNIPKATK